MSYINNNTWYYCSMTTAPTYNNGSGHESDTYLANEVLLNTTSELYTKNKSSEIQYGSSNYIPLPIYNYGFVCGTRILALANTVIRINIFNPSGSDINYYQTTNNNSAISVTHALLHVDYIPNSYISRVISMTKNTEYTIILTQQNSIHNSSLFVNTQTSPNSGLTYIGINNAFSGTKI
jgi:hypothetical protein